MQETIYEKDGGKDYHVQKHFLDEDILDLIARNRKIQFGAFVKPTDNVLEFGVGPGWNLRYLKCASKHGFDVATTLEELVEAAGIQFHSNQESLDEQSFDVVLCSHVLEHVPSPKQTLEIILSLLKPGGLLVLCVPTDLGRKYFQFNPNDQDQHLFSWNNQTIAMLVSNCGFEFDETGRRPFGYSVFAAKLLLRLHLPTGLYRSVWRCLNWLKPIPEIFVLARRPS